MVLLDVMDWLGNSTGGIATLIGTFIGPAFVAGWAAVKSEQRKRARRMLNADKPTFDSDAPEAVATAPIISVGDDRLGKIERAVAEMMAWDLEAARAETRRCQYDLAEAQRDLSAAQRELVELRYALARANERIYELERKSAGSALAESGERRKPVRSGVQVREEYAPDVTRKDKR